MNAPNVLAHLTAAGLKLTPLRDGRLWVEPKSRLTDELRVLIRTHKPELLAALDPGWGDAVEDRRNRVLAALEANPQKKIAALADVEADPRNVIVTLAIRSCATCELAIPREKWDGVLFLELLDRHCASGVLH